MTSKLHRFPFLFDVYLKGIYSANRLNIKCQALKTGKCKQKFTFIIALSFQKETIETLFHLIDKQESAHDKTEILKGKRRLLKDENDDFPLLFYKIPKAELMAKHFQISVLVQRYLLCVWLLADIYLLHLIPILNSQYGTVCITRQCLYYLKTKTHICENQIFSFVK